MRKIIVGPQDEGRRLDRYLSSLLSGAGAGQIQKLIRLKEIKVNGRPAGGDHRLHAGEEVKVFAPEEYFEKAPGPDPFLSRFRPHVQVAWEDENLLVADKKPGLLVHPDDSEKVDTLINHVRALLYQRGQYDPKTDYSPAPCNRIDRFTGGLVILAKNREALLAMDKAIREHRVDKDYLLAIEGRMNAPEGRLTHYMIHEGKAMKVTSRPAPGAQKAILTYKTLHQEKGLSLLRARLITGRTHQIRAQFAHVGHPLVGDNQYGSAKGQKKWGLGHQALYAYRLQFHFEDGPLRYLDGKQVTSRHAPFVKALFPGYRQEENP